MTQTYGVCCAVCSRFYVLHVVRVLQRSSAFTLRDKEKNIYFSLFFVFNFSFRSSSSSSDSFSEVRERASARSSSSCLFNVSIFQSSMYVSDRTLVQHTCICLLSVLSVRHFHSRLGVLTLQLLVLIFVSCLFFHFFLVHFQVILSHSPNAHCSMRRTRFFPSYSSSDECVVCCSYSFVMVLFIEYAFG